MKLTCPCCDAEFSEHDIESMILVAAKDAQVQEYFKLLTPLPAALVESLVRYIDLFRTGKSKISWGRKVRLAQETLELVGCKKEFYPALTEALQRCYEVKSVERSERTFSPFGNHNYLKPILQEKLNAVKRQPVPPKPMSPVPKTEDVAPAASRARHEKAAPMPDNIRRVWNDILGKKTDNRTEEEREQDFLRNKTETARKLKEMGV